MSILSFLQTGSTSYGLFLLQSLAAIFAILAVVYFVFRALRKYYPDLTKEKGRSVEIIERIPVGPKQSLIVVQYKNKRHLLGVTDGGISVLDSDGDS